eukprot:7377037-Prymnesium_polylepis.1
MLTSTRSGAGREGFAPLYEVRHTTAKTSAATATKVVLCILTGSRLGASSGSRSAKLTCAPASLVITDIVLLRYRWGRART